MIFSIMMTAMNSGATLAISSVPVISVGLAVRLDLIVFCQRLLCTVVQLFLSLVLLQKFEDQFIC